MSKCWIAVAALSLMMWVGKTQGEGETRPATRPAPKVSDKLSVTEHQITVAGQPLKYRATAGYMPVKDENGKEKANFFFVAYEKLPVAEPQTRTLTYVFNGGPGAAAVWLHMGALGPMRVSLKDKEGHAPAPPYKLVENESTWLDWTDLVFIDPIGTGFSRPAPGEKGEQFWGVREDVASVAEFIRLYTTKYERWSSPKFLAGESYGTTRAAQLSEYLAEHTGIAVNGVILISTVLNFQTLSPSDGNDLPYPLFLPTYTATAWYHKKLAPALQDDLPKTLKEVEAFAQGEYAQALAKGGSLTTEQHDSIVDKLAKYTSLPATFIDKSDLRIGPSTFRKMLLNNDRKIIGRFDTRIASIDPSPANTYAEYDPSLSEYLPIYTATFNDYVRRELKYESDLSYEVLTSRVHPWNYGPAGNGYLNVTDDLRSAMVKLPAMKLLVCSGRFDLATPYEATNYTVNHLDMARELKANITQTYYPGGHMIYHNLDALSQLREDVRKFMDGAK
jgi:carboxypeptidase C (cathepsin A)